MLRYLYPNIDKDEMLRFFDLEERQRSISPTGYIQSEIVMVAKTERLIILKKKSINRNFKVGTICFLSLKIL